MTGPVALATPRLRMRPVALADLDALHRIWTEPQVRKYLWDDEVIPRARAAEQVERSVASFAEHGRGLWGLRTPTAEALIGFCGLIRIGGVPGVELIYGLDPPVQGRGLATEAARAVLRYGFGSLGLAEIWAGADPPNAASLRVMDRLGMRFATRMRLNDVDVIYRVIGRTDFARHALRSAALR